MTAPEERDCRVVAGGLGLKTGIRTWTSKCEEKRSIGQSRVGESRGRQLTERLYLALVLVLDLAGLGWAGLAALALEARCCCSQSGLWRGREGGKGWEERCRCRCRNKRLAQEEATNSGQWAWERWTERSGPIEVHAPGGATGEQGSMGSHNSAGAGLSGPRKVPIATRWCSGSCWRLGGQGSGFLQYTVQ